MRDALDIATIAGLRQTRFIAAVLATRAGKSAQVQELLAGERDFSFHGEGKNFGQPVNVDAVPVLERYLAGRKRHDATQIEELAVHDRRDANRALWKLAAAGDGAALSAQLRTQGLDGRGVVDLVGTNMPRGKDDLKNWVRWSYPPPCTTCGLEPLLAYAAARRDAAAALGDDEAAREMKAMAKRLVAVMSRRDIAVPLQLLTMLSAP
jgi:hypothetical protein